MKNISHNVTNVTKRLLVAALTLATVSPLSLDGMKRLRENDDLTGQSPVKKQKTMSAQKPITLVCHDGTKIPASYQALSQSKTLKEMVGNYDGDGGEIILPSFIASQTMKDVIKYMYWVSIFVNNGYTEENIILELFQKIKNKIPKNEADKTALIIADYQDSAEWLGFELFSHALHLAKNKEHVLLICNDTIGIQSDYSLLIKHLEPIKLMIDDCGGLENAPKTLPVLFSRKTWDIMIHCMKFIDKEEIKINGLIEEIKNYWYSAPILKECIEAANCYNFVPLQCALSELIAQDIHNHGPIKDALSKFILQDACGKDAELSRLKQYLPIDDLVSSVAIAYQIFCNDQLDPKHPVTVKLKDLTNYGILDKDIIQGEGEIDIASCIIKLIHTSQFDRLQNVLDLLTKNATSFSIKAHQVLVDYVKKLTQDEIKELFGKLDSESTLKMALRLVYAQKHKADLDGLGCNYFIGNIDSWVNGLGFGKTSLFSQAYLQYVLPLIEPLIGVPVTKLKLSYNNLTSLPDQIGNLVNLQSLDLALNKLTSLPDFIGNLVNLQSLDLAGNQLTSLPDSFGNLTNLKELDLFSNQLTSLPDWIGNRTNLTYLSLSCNQLTDEMKQKLTEQFGSIHHFYI